MEFSKAAVGYLWASGFAVVHRLSIAGARRGTVHSKAAPTITTLDLNRQFLMADRRRAWVEIPLLVSKYEDFQKQGDGIGADEILNMLQRHPLLSVFRELVLPYRDNQLKRLDRPSHDAFGLHPELYDWYAPFDPK